MIWKLRYQLPFATFSILALWSFQRPIPATAAQPPIRCAYAPESGQPNPLGMRAFITLEETEDHTQVRYEQLPTNLPGQAQATLAVERTLTFYGMNVDEVRQLLLNQPNYYTELVGAPDPDGFAPMNSVLQCQAGEIPSYPAFPMTLPNLSTGTTGSPDPASQPTDNSPRQSSLPDLSGRPPAAIERRPVGTSYDTIATLPDGNYRYWSAETTQVPVSEDELLRQGGALFLFRKTGNRVVGTFAYVDQVGVCLEGQVNGNMITGTAIGYEVDGRDPGEVFISWRPGGYLQVRRVTHHDARTLYGGAILDLNGFSRINAGQALPPQRCE